MVGPDPPPTRRDAVHRLEIREESKLGDAGRWNTVHCSSEPANQLAELGHRNFGVHLLSRCSRKQRTSIVYAKLKDALISQGISSMINETLLNTWKRYENWHGRGYKGDGEFSVDV